MLHARIKETRNDMEGQKRISMRAFRRQVAIAAAMLQPRSARLVVLLQCQHDVLRTCTSHAMLFFLVKVRHGPTTTILIQSAF